MLAVRTETVASLTVMPLTEEAFTALVDAGCRDCPTRKLTVEAIVAQKVPLLGGEAYGAPSWIYKGEDLVRGTYRIACAGCKRELFSATECPRCQAANGVARALETENGFLVSESCARCGSEQLTMTAFVAASVLYEGKRANKARSTIGPHDQGFHAVRIECKACGDVEERQGPCPVCAAPSTS